MEDEKDRQIRKLDAQTVRRIASGQVIVSMSSAVKELIENSLDAGAKCITIRFVNQGKDLIEIADNGSGIEESNFELLGKRNCTSKLFTFDHLNLVKTFGFRGEALNSLCNLANVKIHTRHSSKNMGTVLTFDTNGKIISKDLKPREIGTTITLSQLFNSLPVRRKELLTNLRRSFDKTLSIIYQYCLGVIGFKIIVLHKKNNSETFSTIFTNNGISLQSNIIDIFDYKQFSNLMPFVCDRNIDDGHSIDVNKNLEIDGFVSKPDTGCGRSATDRQYFYINGKPCDLPDVAKKINQIYRTFNRNQYPFILLRINIDEKIVDRNFTPDKRKIMLADNHYLLKVIMNSIDKMFCPNSSQVLSLSQSQSNLASFLKRAQDEIKRGDENSHIKMFKPNPFEEPQTTAKANLGKNSTSSQLEVVFEQNPRLSVNPLHPYLSNLAPEVRKISTELGETTIGLDSSKNIHPNSNLTVPVIELHAPIRDKSHDKKESKKVATNIIQEESENEFLIIASRKNQEVSISDDEICQKYRQLCLEKSSENISGKDSGYEFQAKIQPEDNSQALRELTHVLSKNSFEEMRIIGQFNLGFIIAEHQKNLFIIDQHAMDERCNFEKFLHNPQINFQNLVCPMNLNLSAIDEMILMDHLDVFQKFGFKIEIDPGSEPGQRVKLTRIPIGKEWNAGKSDVEELIHALRVSPLSFEKIKYFPFNGLKREIAYRACRSSVMIGEVLNKNQMKKILSQMINVRDPWHCAHNRPTIRHLISINRFPSSI